MHMKTIFEIPIYSTSSKNYYQILESTRRKYFENNQLRDVEKIITKLENSQYLDHQNIWLYNYIVGYIQLNFEKPDKIMAAVFFSKKRKIMWNSRGNPIIFYSYCEFIVDIGKCSDNNQVSHRIIEELDNLQTKKKFAKRHISKEPLINLINYIDWIGMTNQK